MVNNDDNCNIAPIAVDADYAGDYVAAGFVVTLVITIVDNVLLLLLSLQLAGIGVTIDCS